VVVVVVALALIVVVGTAAVAACFAPAVGGCASAAFGLAVVLVVVALALGAAAAVAFWRTFELRAKQHGALAHCRSCTLTDFRHAPHWHRHAAHSLSVAAELPDMVILSESLMPVKQ
jgi:hypothetical protein